MSSPRLLVVGARSGSLGEAVVQAALAEWGVDEVITAGISGEEKYYCDLTVGNQIKLMLDQVLPDYIVCTVGENSPAPITETYLPSRMMASYHANVIAPMQLLHHFLATRQDNASVYRKKFVAISSNSARIARSGSIPYCASKAALSMALRVAARDVAGKGTHLPLIWGYEPGLLRGTPMTEQTVKDFGAPDGDPSFGPPLHRMKGVGPRGLAPSELAARIVMDLTYSGPGLHGCLFPYDAGEQ